MMIWRQLFLCLLLMGLLVLVAGCPDRSHLRDVPDYSTMTDGGDDADSE